ncbi:MAG: hypothetical protein ABGZ35_18430 [Planctomycetaceae bacterium]|jgi:hypothetical protein
MALLNQVAGRGNAAVVPVVSLLSDAKTHNPNRLATSASAPDASGTVHSPATDLSDARGRILTTTAAGWFLSFGLHVVGYSVAAFVFWWLGLSLNPEQPDLSLPSIRASLDDETQVDDLPALEIIPVAGPETRKATENVQQLASQLAVAERGQQDTVVTDVKIAVTGTAQSEGGDRGQSPYFRIPESGLAVTKGSFTAWTDPARPEPGQSYQIIIEVRLPDNIKRYRLSDLSGEVTGSDRYRQKLPFDSRTPSAARVTDGAEYKTVRRNMIVKVNGAKLQLAIRVPGAERLVKDRIRIKSRRLRENQELILVFGGSEQPLGLGLESQ